MLTLETLDLPPTLKAQAAALIQHIEQAEGLLELATAGGRTEGFMIGISNFDALRPEQLNGLDDLFSQAMDRKMAEARQ